MATPGRGLGRLRAMGLAAGVFALLAGGDLGAWWVGAPAVALAVATRRWLGPQPSTRVRVRVLPRLILVTLGAAVAGAVDVAWRVLDPRLPLAPALVLHRWGVQGPARLAVVALVNLTPGSVAARSRDEVLWLHVLDAGQGGGSAATWEPWARRLFPDAGGGHRT